MKWLLYCSRHSLANMYHHHFLVRHFVWTSSTSRNRWHLQHYHTASDSPATNDNSFYIKSIIEVTICKLQSCVYIAVSLLLRKYVHVLVRKATNPRLYYTRNNHYTTNRCIFSTSRNELWHLICCPVCKSAHRVAPATSVLCMYAKWTRKIRLLAIYSKVPTQLLM